MILFYIITLEVQTLHWLVDVPPVWTVVLLGGLCSWLLLDDDSVTTSGVELGLGTSTCGRQDPLS